MKKPTAADIAAEFTRGAQAESKHVQCKTCAMPEEIREAVRICLEADPPMSSAALARNGGVSCERSGSSALSIAGTGRHVWTCRR